MITSHHSFYRPILGLLALLLITTANPSLQATILFKENFDDSNYSDGGPLPTGFGEINYGLWTDNATQGSMVTTPLHATAPTPSRVLALYRGPNVEGSPAPASNATARLGDTNASVVKPTDSIAIRFAFNLGASPSNASFNVWGATETSTSDGGVLGYVQMVGDDANPYVRGFFNGSASADRIPIALDTWYYIEVVMPANPDQNDVYTITVFENDGTTQRGETLSGQFYVPFSESSVGYGQLSFGNGSYDTTVYFDDFSVQVIPEPAVISMWEALPCWPEASGVFAERNTFR